MKKLLKRFVVETVISGTTIKVTPRWKWESDTGTIYGNLVKINGYEVNNPDYESFAIAMLETLLIPKKHVELVPSLHTIKLKNPTYINQMTGTIHCSVYLNEVDIAEYFAAFNEEEAAELKSA